MKLRGIIALALVLTGAPALAQVNPGTSPLSGPKGGTNNAFMQFSGPATSLKTYTLPNASDTLAALGQIQTWTGAQSFADGKLVLLGASSGSATLKAPATGGGIATLFPGTDTIAGLAASQTLTNKTFNCASNTCTVRIGSDVSGLGAGVGATLVLATNASGGIVTPAPTRAGDIIYWNGSAWTAFPGNNSGTQFLQENASGVPSWATVAGAGTLTSVAADGGAVTGTGAAITSSGTVYVQQQTPGGRLSLTASTPVTTTDVTAATVINYPPMTSPWVPINNGTVMRQYLFTASATDTVGLQVTLGASWTANTNYDWFIGLNTSTVTLCSGPAWAVSNSGNGTDSRGTGAGTTELQLYNGMWTNKNSMTCRYGNATTFTCAVNQCTYVGTNRTVLAGQAEDSMAKRLVWNLYNQQDRKLKNVTETASSWTYTTVALRQANANAANQLEMVIGLPGSVLDAKVTASGDTSAGGSFVTVGIGINSATVNSADDQTTINALNRYPMSASLKASPAIGQQVYKWLEATTIASGTNSFEGQQTSGGIINIQSGISGRMLH